MIEQSILSNETLLTDEIRFCLNVKNNESTARFCCIIVI